MSRNLSYVNYINQVENQLKKCGYRSEEINALLNRKEVRDYVKEEYRKYSSEDINNPVSGGHDPNAVSYCLDLLY